MTWSLLKFSFLKYFTFWLKDQKIDQLSHEFNHIFKLYFAYLKIKIFKKSSSSQFILNGFQLLMEKNLKMGFKEVQATFFKKNQFLEFSSIKAFFQIQQRWKIVLNILKWSNTFTKICWLLNQRQASCKWEESILIFNMTMPNSF